MGHKYAEIGWTPTIKALQQQHGSRESYVAMEVGPDYYGELGDREIAFLAERDSFYMASVSETEWPYLQHRGGRLGFLKVLNSTTLGFADFSGNRQYMSTGNFLNNNRVSLFFMDYPNRRRMKLFGRVELVDPSDSATLALLSDADYPAAVERGILIQVEGFDWNCPQFITPRYTSDQVANMTRQLESENERLRARLGGREVWNESPDERSRLVDTPEVLGSGPLALEVTAVRRLTPRIVGFELSDPEGKDLPNVTPGSHLRVPVILDNGESSERHYSITSNTRRRDCYEIAVLRRDEGSGGSEAVHRQYRLGTRLQVDPPENHFPLHGDDRPSVLIAGGIGITPIQAMAESLVALGRRFELHYAGASRREMAFLDRLQQHLGDRLKVYSKADEQRLDLEAVLRRAPADAQFYVCGPDRLISALFSAAKVAAVDASRIIIERFG